MFCTKKKTCKCWKLLYTQIFNRISSVIFGVFLLAQMLSALLLLCHTLLESGRRLSDVMSFTYSPSISPVLLSSSLTVESRLELSVHWPSWLKHTQVIGPATHKTYKSQTSFTKQAIKLHIRILVCVLTDTSVPLYPTHSWTVFDLL